MPLLSVQQHCRPWEAMRRQADFTELEQRTGQASTVVFVCTHVFHVDVTWPKWDVTIYWRNWELSLTLRVTLILLEVGLILLKLRDEPHSENGPFIPVLGRLCRIINGHNIYLGHCCKIPPLQLFTVHEFPCEKSVEYYLLEIRPSDLQAHQLRVSSSWTKHAETRRKPDDSHWSLSVPRTVQANAFMYSSPCKIVSWQASLLPR